MKISDLEKIRPENNKGLRKDVETVEVPNQLVTHDEKAEDVAIK